MLGAPINKAFFQRTFLIFTELFSRFDAQQDIILETVDGRGEMVNHDWDSFTGAQGL